MDSLDFMRQNGMVQVILPPAQGLKPHQSSKECRGSTTVLRGEEKSPEGVKVLKGKTS